MKDIVMIMLEPEFTTQPTHVYIYNVFIRGGNQGVLRLRGNIAKVRSCYRVSIPSNPADQKQ